MAKTEKKPVAQLLRDPLSGDVERSNEKEFRAEARRQSLMVASSQEEGEVMDWISDVAGIEVWK